MPCWNIQYNTVVLNNVTNIDTLADALRRLGYQVNVNADNTSLNFLKGSNRYGFSMADKELISLSSITGIKEEIVRAYAGEVARKTAIKAGWEVRGKHAYKFQVVRRKI